MMHYVSGAKLLHAVDCSNAALQSSPAKVRPTYIFDGNI